MLLLPTPAQQKMLDDLDDAIEAHEKALSDEAVAPAQRAWEESVIARLPAQGSGSAKDIDRDGLTAHYELDGSFSDVSGKFLHGRMISGDPTFDAGLIGRAVTFDGDTEVSVRQCGCVRSRRCVQPCRLDAAARQPSDRRVSEARRSHSIGEATSGGSTTCSCSTSSAGRHD